MSLGVGLYLGWCHHGFVSYTRWRLHYFLYLLHATRFFSVCPLVERSLHCSAPLLLQILQGETISELERVHSSSIIKTFGKGNNSANFVRFFDECLSCFYILFVNCRHVCICIYYVKMSEFVIFMNFQKCVFVFERANNGHAFCFEVHLTNNDCFA